MSHVSYYLSNWNFKLKYTWKILIIHENGQNNNDNESIKQVSIRENVTRGKVEFLKWTKNKLVIKHLFQVYKVQGTCSHKNHTTQQSTSIPFHDYNDDRPFPMKMDMFKRILHNSVTCQYQNYQSSQSQPNHSTTFKLVSSIFYTLLRVQSTKFNFAKSIFVLKR